MSFIVIQAGFATHTGFMIVYLYHNLLIASIANFLMQMIPINNRGNDRYRSLRQLTHHTTHSNNGSIPFVKTYIIDRFWYLPDGIFDTSVRLDGALMHVSIYVYFEAGLEYALEIKYALKIKFGIA